ncbi:MAG: AIPR family protein, partial [Planctomycetes bacterium]|nr:AIPR family protein [Planctomycetota bacterium]
SIIAPDRTDEIVPKISQFANTQNRVNAADFFANHPFHVRMEGFSRRLFAPSPEGTFRDSKWFYERARGQYLDARGGLSDAARKKFDLEHPKRQMFTKTDLAKFLNLWSLKPHVVSRGAQKNFADFAVGIGKDDIDLTLMTRIHGCPRTTFATGTAVGFVREAWRIQGPSVVADVCEMVRSVVGVAAPLTGGHAGGCPHGIRHHDGTTRCFDLALENREVMKPIVRTPPVAEELVVITVRKVPLIDPLGDGRALVDVGIVVLTIL